MKTGKPMAMLRSFVELAVALLLLAACTQPAPSPEAPSSLTPIPSTQTPLAQGAPTQTGPAMPSATASTEPGEPTLMPSPKRVEAVPPPVSAPVVFAPCEPGDREPDSSFVTDLSLPDGSQLPPAAHFSKTWRLRNSGTCAWPEGIALVLISGQPLGSPDRIPVPQVAAGREVDISVALTAPSQPGTYEGYWRLRTADGHLFGAVVFTEIEVVSGAALLPLPSATPVLALALPTASPTQTPTAIPSSTPVASPTARPTATVIPPTPTPRPTVTAVPTMTPRPSPTPTATEQPLAEGACRPPDPRFASVAGQATAIGVPVACATGPVAETTGLLQAYWQNVDNVDPHLRFRSVMIARDDTQQVYALDSEDVNTYQASIDVYPNTWTPAMPDRPEACAPLAAPQGYVMPIQGLGKVWCEQSMWNTLGWPREVATAATLAVQETEHGVLIEVTTLPLKVYLIAADLDIRTATLQQVP